jgi:hypothetical protein
MNRWLAVCLLLLLLLSCAKEQPVADLQIDRKMIRVLVIGAAFAEGDEQSFNRAFGRVQMGAALLEQGNDVKFDLKSEFLKKDTVADTTLGIVHHGEPENCYFNFKNALANIHAVGTTFTPEYYLVVFAVNGSGGCTDGKTMVVEFGATHNVVAHELGHAVLGLYDERGGNSGKPADPTNCSTSPTETPWDHLRDAHIVGDPVAGCRFSNALFCPSDTCKMRSVKKDFCARCAELVTDALTARATAPPSSQLFADVLVADSNVDDSNPNSIEVDAIVHANGTVKILAADPVDADMIATPVIVGDTFAVVDAKSDDGDRREIVAIVSLSIDDGEPGPLIARRSDLKRRLNLRARSYIEDGTDILVPVDARLLRLTLVGIRPAEVRARDLMLSLRTLEHPERGKVVTPAIREKLRMTSPAGEAVGLSAPLAAFLFPP